MPASVLIETQYLPSIAYFCSIAACHEIIVEKHEHYEKQTYRNRCYINSAGGKATLIVPVTFKHNKSKISEVKIDHSQKWLNNHWRTIQSGYGKAPFYEYYKEDLFKILFTRFELLYDLNHALLTMCLKWLGWSIPIRETLIYEPIVASGVRDRRSAINPKKTDILERFYQPAVYHQVFGNKFVENLSLIDLVFCQGPGAVGIVQASTPK